MIKKTLSIIHILSHLPYVCVSMLLFGISCLIIIWSTYDIVTLNLLSERNTTGTFLNSMMMDEVAYIVFAVAVADVARYLLVE
ncbi:MAG: hypothetical protein EB051_01295, partial [Chlamydiia bacterium]|nr:hypothetical protein [Chlamydiia bacterium]